MRASEEQGIRMRTLIERIREADTAYYKYDRPVMPDREYDLLMEELKGLETDTGVVLSGSPTQAVPGEVLEGLAVVCHTKPMLSADKTKSLADLERFAGSQPVVLSWKLDGLTLVLRYRDGKLERAITRGRNGLVGEDVTHTARTFLNIPLEIPEESFFEVRGEGVISWANFEKINAGLEEPYAHPRNLAAGSVRNLDSDESRKRYLEFFAFELVSAGLGTDSKMEQLDFLAQNGFSVVPHVLLAGGSGPERITGAAASFRPAEFAYPADGLIMEYDSIRYGESLGATGHHENRLIALKWEDELYETTFLGLDTAVTQSGMVSLTGVFEPVVIDGAKVGRAYLHNYDNYARLALGKGDRIQVYKANMIIPQIAENLTKSGTCMAPSFCPCCGAPLMIRISPGGTRQLFCENPDCAARLVKKFVHFCDKTRMDIEGLSEKTLGRMLGHGWIRTYGDLYTLEQHRDEMIGTAGFGVKSFERLQASIEKSRHCTLARFIAGMGIPMVGRHAGRDLDHYFHGSFEAFEQAIINGFDFTRLPDFGEAMNENIHNWYASGEDAGLWRPLLDHIEFIKEEDTMETAMSNPFEGKTVVATGKLENYTRDGIQAKLLSLGAKPASSVTKKTDYLIVGEKAGSKLKKAVELGIRTLTEQEFEDMLAG
ncbi:MAG: NAD-dependent DNA ligase LigA [Lachnospiraceae bacterium]|nr:NAD-dependent DNA ligase LigA [Lachnospiraceae bacterium]